MKFVRRTEHDGDSESRHVRFRSLRRLTLRGPGGATFLDRFGIETGRFGVYVHRIAAPDPGLDLHDHPWPFVSIILSGGYTEEVADTREAPVLASIAESYAAAGVAAQFPDACRRGFVREWRRGTVHRLRMTEAHRITAVRPHTWTLLLRGPKSRTWGFYLPSGWVSQYRYDYAARRPCSEVRS